MSLRRLVRHLRTAERESESELGLGTAQLFVLSRLAESEASSIRERAARTMTDPSTVSVVLGKLVARGHVKRKAHPTDARRQVLALTPKGRAVLERSPELPQRALVDALAALTPARRRAIASSLASLVDALGAGESPASLLFADEDARPRRPKGGSRGR